MLKLALSITAAGALGLGVWGLSSPAAAQTNSRGEVIVYGNDPCPRSTDDSVVVCVRRKEEERFRIPQAYRPSGTRQQSQSWSTQSRALTTAGATGTNSCSAVGPGGWAGCLQQEIDQAKQEADEAQQTDTPPAKVRR
jgi:hypothetical protein